MEHLARSGETFAAFRMLFDTLPSKRMKRPRLCASSAVWEAPPADCKFRVWGLGPNDMLREKDMRELHQGSLQEGVSREGGHGIE